MVRALRVRKWLVFMLMVGALLVALAAGSLSRPAKAQSSNSLRTFRFPTVTVNNGETLRIIYSNLSGNQAYTMRTRFLDAHTGVVLAGTKLDPLVSPGTGETSDYTNNSGTPAAVIPILQLAEPRPDPIASVQLLVGNDRIDWLAEPRPDPILVIPAF